MDDENKKIEKVQNNDWMFWVFSILAPICVKLIMTTTVNQVVGFYIQRSEGITDLVDINQRFADSGLGVMSIAISCIITTAIIIRMLKNDIDSFGSEHWYGLHKINTEKTLLYILIAGIMAVLLNVLISLGSDLLVSKEFENTQQLLFSGTLVLRLISLGIIVPICEELLFRGLIYKRLTDRVNVKWAVIISALLFGIYHLNIVQLIYASIMGICLGFVYEKEKNIAYSVIFHAAANVVIIMIENSFMI